MSPLTIFIVLSSAFAQNNFSCRHLFRDEYLYFMQLDTNSRGKPYNELNSFTGRKGVLQWSACGTINVPQGCTAQGDKVKAVFVDEEGGCKIFLDEKSTWNWFVSIAEDRSRKIVAKQDKNDKLMIPDSTIQYEFICSQTNGGDAYFDAEHNKLVITENGRAGCGYSLNFLRSITEHPIITLAILLFLGSILNFMGIKFYNDLFYYLIGILVIIFGVYVYGFLSGTNVVFDLDNNWINLGLTVLAIIVVIGLVIYFTSVVMVLLSFLAAYQLGVYFSNFLKPFIHFLDDTWRLWLLVAIIFLALLILNWQLKDYFVIISTALIGSAFISTALMYFYYKNWEFLFSLNFDSIEDISNYETTISRYAITGILLFIIGGMVQYWAFKRTAVEPAESGPKELRIELKGV